MVDWPRQEKLGVSREELDKMLQVERDNLVPAAANDCWVRGLKLAKELGPNGRDTRVTPNRVSVMLTVAELDLVKEFLIRDNTETPHTKSVLGFVYFGFHSRYWWFDSVQTLRKLFLNGMVIFIPNLQSQFAASLLLCFVTVCSQLVRIFVTCWFGMTDGVMQAMDPFKDESDNVIQAVLIGQLFLTLFAGLLAQFPATLSAFSTAADFSLAEVRQRGAACRR